MMFIFMNVVEFYISSSSSFPMFKDMYFSIFEKYCNFQDKQSLQNDQYDENALTTMTTSN